MSRSAFYISDVHAAADAAEEHAEGHERRNFMLAVADELCKRVKQMDRDAAADAAQPTTHPDIKRKP